jgi:hypothetical protein
MFCHVGEPIQSFKSLIPAADGSQVNGKEGNQLSIGPACTT